MQNLVQSDIFFFVTTIAVVIVTIFFVVILVYIIRILKNIKYVSDVVKKNAKFFSGDLSKFRVNIKKFLQSFATVYKRKTKKK